jgi:hypothetical protein
MRKEAVYFRIDTERTSGIAYNEFKMELEKQFRGNISISDSRGRMLSAPDPNLILEAAEFGYVLLQSISAAVFVRWLEGKLAKRSSSDESPARVYITNGGPIYFQRFDISTREQANKQFWEDKIQGSDTCVDQRPPR